MHCREECGIVPHSSSRRVPSPSRVTLSAFPYSPLTMCKIGKLSFAAGAELPKRYIVA
jgi:hypothetical protein